MEKPLQAGSRRYLLGETKPYLGSKSCGSSSVGIGNHWLVNRMLIIELDVEFLIHYITDVWPKLEVDVSVCYDVELIDLTLYGFRVAKGHVHTESEVVL